MAAEVHYVTAGKKRILEILEECRDQTVTAAQISERLKASGNAVNITTIYRNLDKLEKDGIIIRYTSRESGQAVYQYAGQDNHCCEHLHLKCVKCGQILHLDCAFMEEISHHIKEDHGFSIQCRNSIIYGVCRECSKEQS